MVLFSITGTSIKDQHPIRDNYIVRVSIPKIIFVSLLFCYGYFVLIGPPFIDPDTFTWVVLQIVCEPYPNQKYRFAHPLGFSKVVKRVSVVRSYFP